MANNPYVNKVQTADGATIIDISDTTATAEMVDSLAHFYTKSGQKVQGTGRQNMWADGDVDITASRGYNNLDLTQQLPAGRYTIVAKNVTTYTGDRVLITFHSVTTSSSMSSSNRVGMVYLPANSTSSVTFTLSGLAKSARVEAGETTTSSSGCTATYSDIFLLREPNVESESGTYSPTENVSRPTISFANAHATRPIFVMIFDSGVDAASSNSILFWGLSSPYDYTGEGVVRSAGSTQYAMVAYWYKTSSSATMSSTAITSLTGTYTECLSYWVSESGFMPYAMSSSRYFRSGRTYKWIAVWASA